MVYKNAETAFIDLYDRINREGHRNGNGTKALYNIGFYLDDPRDNHINVRWRKWNVRYAQREWNWYLSQNRSVKHIKKYAPIWDTMHGGDNIVNSNYGWQWNRNDQLIKCYKQLTDEPTTRQAWLTIHDGKEKDTFQFDTPCTLSIGFQIIENKLCMNVHMRSNDLWYGFCNDQYCFSMLQIGMALALKIPIGWYYHFAANLHIYEEQYDLDQF